MEVWAAEERVRLACSQAVGLLMIQRTFDRDNSVVDGCSEVRFSGFLHLKGNHGVAVRRQMVAIRRILVV